jgi:hypothetical protein
LLYNLLYIAALVSEIFKIFRITASVPYRIRYPHPCNVDFHCIWKLNVIVTTWRGTNYDSGWAWEGPNPLLVKSDEQALVVKSDEYRRLRAIVSSSSTIFDHLILWAGSCSAFLRGRCECGLRRHMGCSLVFLQDMVQLKIIYS